MMIMKISLTSGKILIDGLARCGYHLRDFLVINDIWGQEIQYVAQWTQQHSMLERQLINLIAHPFSLVEINFSFFILHQFYGGDHA